MRSAHKLEKNFRGINTLAYYTTLKGEEKKVDFKINNLIYQPGNLE